jgi:tripartite-type tricarboxylate transporter receptor subunit TctC
MNPRKILAALLCGGTAALLAPAHASASGFPEHSITIVVPTTAGGGTDTLARQVARALSEYWKVPVVVQNIPGAEGLIGSQRVLREPADGYTWLLQITKMLLWKKTMPGNGIDVLADFDFVSKLQTAPMAFGVSSKLPVKTFPEFIQWCKAKKPNCSWGTATAYGQLIGRQLMDIAGLKNTINIPYKGTTPMLTDTIGGHVDMAIPSLSSGMAQARGGLFRMLAVASAQPSPFAPDVPSLKQMGFDVQAEDWYGILTKKGTPQPVLDAIEAGIKAVSKDPALLRAIRSTGSEPVFDSSKEFTRDVAQEIKLLDTLFDKYQ